MVQNCEDVKYVRLYLEIVSIVLTGSALPNIAVSITRFLSCLGPKAVAKVSKKVRVCQCQLPNCIPGCVRLTTLSLRRINSRYTCRDDILPHASECAWESLRSHAAVAFEGFSVDTLSVDRTND